jgi:predicted PurR-regulated permease PerM
MKGRDIQAAPKPLPGQIESSPPCEGPCRSPVSGWALAAVFSVIAIILYEVRFALLPLVFATGIAFVMDPVIKALQRRLGSPRWVAAVLLYLVILAIFGGAGYWVVQIAAPELMRVVAHASEVLRRFLTEFLGRKGITMAGHTYTPDRILEETGAAAADMLRTGLVGDVLSMTASAVFGSVLLLVLMPYLMISGPRLAAGTIWLLPPERRHSVEVLLPKLIPELRRYLVGVFLVVILTATLGWIGFGAIFHLPHAVPLALAVGVLELIPFIGPTASMVIVGVVAVQQTSFMNTVFLMAFAIALRLAIDNLFGPLVLGQAARVHPVVIIIGFVVGAMLFGIIGLLLAVPMVVIIRTVLQDYYSEPIRGRSQA